MLQAIRNFFNSGDFMPHGHCFLWQPDILWLHVLSDAGIVFAYYCIPFVLFYFIRNRKDLPFKNVFWLFGAFILLCGTTHLMSIWVLWHPDYALEGVIKAATAIASIATLIITIRLLPAALLLVSPDAVARLESENRLHAIVDNTAEGMITIGENGIIQSFNKTCERLFGYRPDETIGQNIKMLMPEPTRSEHDGYIDRYKKTGEGHIIGTVGREVEGLRKDGTVFPLELSVSVVPVGGTRIFSGILRDISQRKEAEKKLAHMAAIVESSADAIISKSPDGIITSWNHAAETLFGYTAAEAVGKHIDIIIPQDHQAEETRILGEVRGGKKIEHYETVRVTKSGRMVDVSISISPIIDPSGRVIGASKISRDISERRALDRRLQRAIADLKRSNEELESFTYIASHDLKEPLRGIASNVRFLREDCGPALDEKAISRLGRMHYLCQRLERLVDDLLYFSRLGRQELAIQRADLNAIVKDIETMMETTLHEANACIVIPKPLPAITCDATRITEVFRNLITNAVKYNKSEEKRIEIGVAEMVPPGGDKPQNAFYVRDNGIGIAPEFHTDVFRLFKRLNSEDDSVKGTGVGLTIVKKIIDRHQGSIWVDSAEGAGTTFYFTLNPNREN